MSVAPIAGGLKLDTIFPSSPVTPLTQTPDQRLDHKTPTTKTPTTIALAEKELELKAQGLCNRVVSVTREPETRTRIAALKHGFVVGKELDQEYGVEGKTKKVMFGPNCRYIFVPANWKPKPDVSKTVQVFGALGVGTPNLVFRSLKSRETFPNSVGLRKRNGEDSEFEVVYEDHLDVDGDGKITVTEDEKSFFKLMMESQLTSLCATLGTACAEVKAYYLMEECRSENEFAVTLLQTLPRDGVAIAFCNMDQGYESYWMSDAIKVALKTNSVSLDEDVQNTVEWPSRLEPSLKHLVIFENSNDQANFLEDVAKDVPVGVLGAAGTKPLKTLVWKSIEQGRPVFILKHTLRNGHLFTSLIEDANARDTSNVAEGNGAEGDKSRMSLQERLFPDNKDPYRLQEYGGAAGNDVFPRNIPSSCESYRFHFPKSFNRDAVMIIDPLKLPPQHKLLQDIANVMSTIYDSKPDGGEEEVEEIVIRNAVEMLSQLQQLEKSESARAWFIKSLILVLGFATTVSACTYQELKNEDPTRTDLSGLKGLTIILPVFLGVFLTLGQTWASYKRWSIIMLNRTKVEKEICRYECKVGEYRAMVGEGPVHRHNFTKRITAIWRNIDQNDLVHHAIVGMGFAEENYKRIESGRMSPLKKGILDRVKKDNEKREKDAFLIGLGVSLGLKKINHFGRLLERKIEKERTTSVSSEDYIKARLEKKLTQLSIALPRLSLKLRAFQFLLVTLSASTAIMASYEQQMWIPAVLAGAAMLEGFVEFGQLPLRMEVANLTFTKLKRTQLWWNSLGPVQKKLPAMKTRLVTEVEDAILDEVVAVSNKVINNADDSVNKDTAAIEVQASPKYVPSRNYVSH